MKKATVPDDGDDDATKGSPLYQPMIRLRPFGVMELDDEDGDGDWLLVEEVD